MKKLSIDEEKVRDLFFLMERLNEFFHQEKNFTTAKIKSFAEENYQSINKAYYETLWDMLPEEERNKIIEG